uniref:Uncharacterized protein n=1 Tax=Ascaris lumbricoides TaxID=6252 RepID=A0A0M3HM22_ASCLU
MTKKRAANLLKHIFSNHRSEVVLATSCPSMKRYYQRFLWIPQILGYRLKTIQ